MIVKTVLMRCDQGRAFALFTQEASRWWPPDKRHTDDRDSMIRIESSGRFFERARDGVEVELGAVVDFDPPRRLEFDWYPGTGPADPTRVEVRFEAVDGGTLVTVTHGIGSATPDAFSRAAFRYEAGWTAVLAAIGACDSGNRG